MNTKDVPIQLTTNPQNEDFPGMPVQTRLVRKRFTEERPLSQACRKGWCEDRDWSEGIHCNEKTSQDPQGEDGMGQRWEA